MNSGNCETGALAPLLPRANPIDKDSENGGGASISGAVFNVSTSMIGAGIMSIPATLKVLGIIPAFFLILLVALSVDVTVEFLLRYTGSADSTSTYGGVMAESFGKAGSVALQICVVITNLGALIIYMIIIGDVLSGNHSEGTFHLGILQEWFGIQWWNSRVFSLLLITLFVMLPLLLLRNIDSLRHASAISILLAVVFVIICSTMAIFSIMNGKIQNVRLLPDFSNGLSVFDLFTTIPVYATAFGCHVSVHPVRAELSRSSDMKPALRLSLLLCVVIYSAIGFFGYLLFGDSIMTDLLVNFDESYNSAMGSIINDVVRLSYAVHLMMVFPVINYTLRANLDELLFPRKSLLANDNLRFIGMTCIILSSIYLAAIAIPDIWYFFQFMGTTTVMCLMFLFPCAIILRDKHGIAGSGDKVWFDNVPHPKLVEYKKDQNWVNKSGDYLVFPGGGTQFKDGVTHYIDFVEKTLPEIKWGKHIRVILDVGCGVASFGGFLIDKDVLTMSFAPKDEHEAQIQFALERGIPATLSVIGTQRLTYPDNAFDLIHCARCRVHWDADGGKPLIELNRVLRPGGFFVWSATPVYRDNDRDQKVWKAMVVITEGMCWKVVAKNVDSSGIGMVIYQKPVSSSCYESREEDNPPICDPNKREKTSWYAPLDDCLTPLPTDTEPGSHWPTPWPERLNTKPESLTAEPAKFYADSKQWSGIVYDVYLDNLGINWTSVRNVIDMKAGYGGFAAALVKLPLWVMNVVPVNEEDTLSVIFDRGLVGIYHDWCESLSTYPRTYDLLHSSFLFKSLTQRCNVIEVAAEMDRVLRPGGIVLILDEIEIITKLTPIFRSLHWSTKLYHQKFLVCKKGFWRPGGETKLQ